jgi:hypothetical protein
VTYCLVLFTERRCLALLGHNAAEPQLLPLASLCFHMLMLMEVDGLTCWW